MSIQHVSVTSMDELNATLTSYIAQGFVVANRTETSATLQKPKEFKILWAVIGFILCLLPLLIYLIVYATKPDVEVVEVVINKF